MDWKGVDCGVSMGSEVEADARAALVSIWKPLAAVVLCWGNGVEVGGVLILCSSAGAVTVAVLRGQEASTVSVAVWAGGAGPEGRRGRLAAWAPSAEGPSCVPGMAWKQTAILTPWKPWRRQTSSTFPRDGRVAWTHQSGSHPLGQLLIQVVELRGLDHLLALVLKLNLGADRRVTISFPFFFFFFKRPFTT